MTSQPSTDPKVDLDHEQSIALCFRCEVELSDANYDLQSPHNGLNLGICLLCAAESGEVEAITKVINLARQWREKEMKDSGNDYVTGIIKGRCNLCRQISDDLCYDGQIHRKYGSSKFCDCSKSLKVCRNCYSNSLCIGDRRGWNCKTFCSKLDLSTNNKYCCICY